MARNQANENFLTPARQKPKGRFKRRTTGATVQRFNMQALLFEIRF
jgi:hypothetical protein